MPVDVRTDIKGLARYLLTSGADREKLRLHVSEVGPGKSSHPPHQHEGQEIFYVLDGEAEVLVGDEKHRVNGGEALQVDCQILHGISNAGNGPLRYAVIIAA